MAATRWCSLLLHRFFLLLVTSSWAKLHPYSSPFVHQRQQWMAAPPLPPPPLRHPAAPPPPPSVSAASPSWFHVPNGTKWMMTHMLTIPVAAITTISVNVPITYTFDGGSNMVLSSGRSLEEEQRDVFQMIEDTLLGLGMDGKACLLRAICEISESPMRDLTLIGEILTLVLTPRKSLEDRSFLLDYLKAEDFGRRRPGSCWKMYYACPFSVRHLLAGLRYHKR